MLNIYKLIKLSIYDLKHKPDKRDISGIWCYVGDFGQGKTLSLVRQAQKLKKEGYNVYSNFSLTFADGIIEHWKDIINVPPNSVVCIDEVGDTFNSRAWQSFPRQIFGHLIQNRKRNIRFLFTAQDFGDLDNSIRCKTAYIIRCRKLARLCINTFYTRKTINRKAAVCEFRDYFVLEDSISDCYNTMEFVKQLEGIKK